MPVTQFPKLAVASMAANFSDQMMLALLPLVLVAAGADAQTVSLVVAAHAAAWLVVSLPVGAYADVMSRRTIMTLGAGAILAGSALGAAGLHAGFDAPWVLAICAFCIAAGVVMLILSVFAQMPKSVPTVKLASANATLEFGRAIMSIATPAIAAVLVSRHWSEFGFGLALVGGLTALIAARALPFEPATSGAKVSLRNSVRDGAAFVVQQPILLAIALCAIAWNMGFFALTGVFAPYAKSQLGMSIEEIGQAWSIYGIGLLLGSLAAAPMIARLPTGFMFIFGPAASCIPVLVALLVARPGTTWPVGAGFFCLGFASMTWLVLQTSVRQIVTPNAMLGRVGATLSMAIYGVRPIGALIAGQIAAALGSSAALWFSAAMFVLSFFAVLLSPAVRLSTLPKPA